MRPSVDKLKSTMNVGTKDTTQAQRYQQICAVTVRLSTRVCADPEASEIFLNGVLEAGKKAEEFLLSKGIHTDRSSVTPSKSSNAVAVCEPSVGTAPKFKERPNPISEPTVTRSEISSHSLQSTTTPVINKNSSLSLFFYADMY